MSEYIDREKLWNEVQHMPFYNNADRDSMEDLILSISHADVAPVKHGRWKGAGMGDYSCSLCCGLVSGNTYIFCPNCGADMRGNSNE